MIQRCGKSGVELHEIRRNVNADGEDTTSKGKPNNGYTDGRRASRGLGFNASRPRSCGFGPSKPQFNEKLPKLNEMEKGVLKLIDDGRACGLPQTNKIAKKLAKIDLVMWSDRDGVWRAMAEGRRVAGLLSSVEDR